MRQHSRNSTTRTARKMAEQLRARRTPTWVVVAHRGGALIFESGSEPGRVGRVVGSSAPSPVPMRLIERVERPQGRLKNSELVSDEPGRVVGRVSSERHAYANPTDAKVVLAEQFARELAEKLRVARAQNRFKRVVLVAESRFLGLLRSSLDRPTATRVAFSVEKDLNAEPLPRLREYLRNLTRPLDGSGLG
jgi:protein required for attachment to host cells